MKFKMKRITILIFFALGVMLAFGKGKENDNVSKSIVLDGANAKFNSTNPAIILNQTQGDTNSIHNYEVKIFNKNVPSYYVIRHSDSNDIEGAVRLT